ncbi:MAG: hypothetical protein ACLFN5_06085 [bacterium]
MVYCSALFTGFAEYSFAGWFQADVFYPTRVLRFLILTYPVIVLIFLFTVFASLFLKERKKSFLRKTLTLFCFFTLTWLALPGFIQLITYPPYRFVNLFSYEILGNRQMDQLRSEPPEFLEVGDYSEKAADNYLRIINTAGTFESAEEYQFSEMDELPREVRAELDEMLAALPKKATCAFPEDDRLDLFARGDSPVIMNSISASRAIMVYVKQLVREGEIERAGEVVQKLLNVTECVYQSKGSFLNYLVAIAQQGIVTRELADILENSTPAEMEPFYKILAEYDQELIKTGLENGFIGEHQAYSKGFASIKIGTDYQNLFFKPLKKLIYGPEKDDRYLMNIYADIIETVKQSFYRQNWLQPGKSFLELIWRNPVNPGEYMTFYLSKPFFTSSLKDAVEDSAITMRNHRCLLLYLEQQLQNSGYRSESLELKAKTDPVTGKKLTADCFEKIFSED